VVPAPGATPKGRARGTLRALKVVANNSIVRVVVRRLVMAIPLLFAVSAVSFLLISLTPGNVAREILGDQATASQYHQLQLKLGLNLPIYEQYWHWVERALHGNLGASLYNDVPVVQAIDSRLPITLSLVGGALLVSLVIGVGLGVLSAVRRGIIGRIVDAVALIGFALPAFWIGVELIVLFAVTLKWFPATGYVSVGTSVGGWLRSLVLPVVALSLGGIAAIAKQTRSAMREALSSSYIQMAWANGASARSVYFRLALKNAMLPVITVLGVQGVFLLSGSVLVETVFALPGLGSLVVTSATQQDLPMVQGIAVYFTIIVIAFNLLVDLAYTWLNPRVRLS
jgi:peptide/nickel transport system permease protein